MGAVRLRTQDLDAEGTMKRGGTEKMKERGPYPPCGSSDQKVTSGIKSRSGRRSATNYPGKEMDLKGVIKEGRD